MALAPALALPQQQNWARQYRAALAAERMAQMQEEEGRTTDERGMVAQAQALDKRYKKKLQELYDDIDAEMGHFKERMAAGAFELWLGGIVDLVDLVSLGTIGWIVNLIAYPLFIIIKIIRIFRIATIKYKNAQRLSRRIRRLIARATWKLIARFLIMLYKLIPIVSLIPGFVPTRLAESGDDGNHMRRLYFFRLSVKSTEQNMKRFEVRARTPEDKYRLGFRKMRELQTLDKRFDRI